MASLAILPCVLWLALNWPTFGNAQTCMTSEQPVVSSIDPPSGTTGQDPSLSTRYTIRGERLDQVMEIIVEIQTLFEIIRLDLLDMEPLPQSIQFHLALTDSIPRNGIPASVMVVPNNSDCSTLVLTISLHDTALVSLSRSASMAQPGTTIAPVATLGTCLPSSCGDNSTMYNVIIGGVMLDLIEATGSSLIARFPEFTVMNDSAAFILQTQYQTFTLTLNQFLLSLQTDDAVIMPSQGQRGTRITITGTRLLGDGESVTLSEVTIGGMNAEVISSSQTMIELRASSGPPGVASVSINTTQALRPDMSFDGPYTYLEDVWTQLEDGFVSDIVPPGVQVGGFVTLCGSRLLGGGASIAQINLAGFSSLNFSQTLTSATTPLPGTECVFAEVPDPSEMANVTGLVELAADTGALVQSSVNFTYAEIQEVSPSRGQPGTRVAIRGSALLSGYSSLDASITSVTLNRVKANVVSSSETEVIVQALEPPSDTNTTNSTDLFGQPGVVVITVQGPGSLSSLSFVVTSDTETWTYEPPGQIDSVTPAFGQFGTLLTITGDNLLSYGTSLTRVTVGGNNAIIVEMTDTVVRVRAPDGSVGAADIVLFADNGAEVSGMGLFEFRERGSVSQVLPDRGQRGTFVTISGTNLFGYGNNLINVMFGDTAADIDFDQSNSTHIIVRIQPNTEITQDTLVSVSIIADTLAVVESARTWTYLVQGTVTNIQPPNGQEGTRVTLTGTNLLGGGTAATQVLMDDVEASIMSASETSIVVVMGSIDSRTASAFPGQAFIMADTGAIVTGGTYTHQSSGTISDFSPRAGRDGTVVTINGQNLLGFGSSISMVTVAGYLGTIISFNESQVVIQVGRGREDDTGVVRLIIDTGAVIVSTSNFTYGPPGVVDDVMPPEGAEGAGVLIRGSALFPNNTQLTSVTVGGNPVTRIVTATTSEISMIVGAAPTNNPMMAEIAITASDRSFVRGVFFRFLDLVISLPGRTSGREGTMINIALPPSPQFTEATNLRATIDEEDAEIVSMSAGVITVRVPRAKRVGTFMADVAIENPQRLVARLINGFTYLPEGFVYIITPDFGQRGTRVVLEGENFLGGGSEISSVMLAGVSAQVTLSTDQRVEVEIAENPSSSTTYPLVGDIILTADTGAVTLRSNGFTIAQPGDVRLVSPMTGQAGTRVTIGGTNLLQGGEEIQMITLAGIQASLMGSPTDTSITVEASPAPSTPPPPGPVEIQLGTGATITSSQNFEYLQAGRIIRLNPNSGTEGTRVVIEGEGLLSGGSAVERVLLGGVEAILESFTDDSVSVVAQSAEPGSGDVEIISDTGARILRESFWTYNQLGSITVINPPVGQQGLVVTLSGTALLGSSGRSLVECRLAGIVGTVVRAVRTEVMCRAGFFPDLISQPENGTGPAELLSDTGVTVRSVENITFTYYIAQIETVAPSTGNNGTIVQISGVNLFGFPNEGSTVESVTIGGVEARVLSSTDTEVRVRSGLSENATQDDTVRITLSDGSFQEMSGAWGYSPLKRIISVTPSTAFSGDTIVISGLNLDAAQGVSVTVVVGQTAASQTRIINDTAVEFEAGVHQSSDRAGEALPLQIVYSTGEIVFEPTVTITYNETRGLIDSITPNAGAENTVVRITGRNLIGNENQTITQVYLAGVEVASIQENATNDEIVVIAGEGPTEGGFGTVVIETSDGQQYGIAGDAWRYYPTLSNSVVSPVFGQNGTTVTVDLSAVDPLPAIETVAFAGSPALVFSVTPSGQLSATVQTTENVTVDAVGDVVIFFANASQLTIMNAWTYRDSVVVNSFTPMQGYYNSLVNLNGQNFQAGGLVTVTSVYLAELETQIVSQSDSMLQVRITELRDTNSQPITGPVVIISSQGATYTSPDNFTYVQVQVDSVNPQEGQRGTKVNITGVGLLLGGSSVSSVTLGEIAGTVDSANDTEIIVSAGDFPSQTNISDIVYRVDTEGELTVPSSWRYIVPGEITSVSPEEGGMGTIVTIMGTNLFGGGSSAEMVLLNNVPAQSIVTNFDSLVQVVAGETTGSLSPGTVQIISDTGAVTESAMNVAYTYNRPGDISTVTPREGQNGTMISISASYLHNGEGVDWILLAGVEATIEMMRENSLQAGFPSTFMVRAGRPSVPHSFSGPVTIISHFGTTSVSTFNFTYLSEGTIFSVTPDRGQDGTTVTIEGENLLGGGMGLVRAYLAGIMADIVGITTSSRVELRANRSPNTMLGDIVLVSDTGAYVRRVDGWSYVEEGIVSGIQPPEGQRGTRITISGQRLLSGGESVVRAYLGGVGLEVTSSSATEVTAQVGQPSSPDSFTATNVTLVSNFGGRLVQSISWVFLNQSMIETVSPASGFGNTRVNITGTNLLGGGMSIQSAVMDETNAMVEFANDTLVVLIAGFNPNGQSRTGDIVLTSDTGAITILENSWTYDRECPQGQYGNTDSCLPCHEECLTCDGPNATDCFTCMNFAMELANTSTRVECVPACPHVATLENVCREVCDPGTFPLLNSTTSTIFCRPCHPQCDPNRRCSGFDATQCEGCRSVHNELNGTCIDACPTGTYQDEQNNCVQCSNQCTLEGCFGPGPTDCRMCANLFVVNETSTAGNSEMVCVPNCPSALYYVESNSSLCIPCHEQCLDGCTGSSANDCIRCKNFAFSFPNGTRQCVAMCNPDPLRQRFYDTQPDGICLPCSDVCSLTRGCNGPSGTDCYNECRVLPDNTTVPKLINECVSSCPNENSTYSFYRNTDLNICEPCDRACTDGCIGPLAADCIQLARPLEAGAGAIAIFVIVVIIVVLVVVALVGYICYQKKHYVYKVNEDEENNLVLSSRDNHGEQETKLDSSTAEDTHGVTNTTFDVGKESPPAPTEIRIKETQVEALKKSVGETGSQEVYTEMSPTLEEEPRYSTPTPKSMRKIEKQQEQKEKEEELKPPPLPAPYKKPEVQEVQEKKPPPPRPPSPTQDELYTDMEAGIQEVHVNPAAAVVEQDEEYSEMAPSPIHQMAPSSIPQVEEVYDDADSVQPAGSVGKPPAPPPKSEEKVPLLEDDLYEDTEGAIAQVNEYKRMSGIDFVSIPQHRQSGVPEKPPELPSRPSKTRMGAPLPQTPLQKSLSTNAIGPSSPPVGDEIYVEPLIEPIEECLYEELPEPSLPPKPKK